MRPTTKRLLWISGLLTITLFALAFWLTGAYTSISPKPARGADAPSVKMPPQRPSHELSINELLGEELATVTKRIGRPGIDNTLPSTLGNKPAKIYRIDGTAATRGHDEDTSKEGNLVVASVCIELSNDQIFYGVVPRSALTQDMVDDFTTGGAMASYRLREASGCGDNGPFSSIYIY